MVMEFKYGRMVPNMKEFGKIIKLMDKDVSSMLMVMYMKVTGQKTKPMALEITNMPTVPCIKEPGNMICKMDMVKKLGLMDQHLLENIKTV